LIRFFTPLTGVEQANYTIIGEPVAVAYRVEAHLLLSHAGDLTGTNQGLSFFMHC
jgi:hypothetical protein